MSMDIARPTHVFLSSDEGIGDGGMHISFVPWHFHVDFSRNKTGQEKRGFDEERKPKRHDE